MSNHQPITAGMRMTVLRLAAPPRIDALGPVAARFIYSLRLIAVHERAHRDPVPELASRLSSVDLAAKAMMLGQAIAAVWPEDVHLTCFCCPILTHDEMTIGMLLDAAAGADPAAFEAAIVGLMRPDRAQRLWEPALALVAAEMRTP